MDLGRTFLGLNQVLPGVSEMLDEVQIEATFPGNINSHLISAYFFLVLKKYLSSLSSVYRRHKISHNTPPHCIRRWKS